MFYDFLVWLKRIKSHSQNIDVIMPCKFIDSLELEGEVVKGKKC